MMLAWMQLANAQDYTFSQFYEQPIMRNPALAGVFNGDFRVSGINRNQWASVTVPYKTTALSVEYKRPIGSANDFLTMGIQTVLDVAGDLKLKRTHVMPFLNFHKSLSEDKDEYLSLAFMGGNISSRFDPSKVRGEEQYVNGVYDPSAPIIQKFDRVNYNYWDLSTGLTYSSQFGYDSRFYVGAALFHANKPKRSYFNQSNVDFFKAKLSINGGVTHGLTDFTRIIAFADYYMQGQHRQVFGGVLYQYDIEEYEEGKVSVAGGAFYRLGDAAVPVVKLDYKRLTVGLSYDVNISNLKTASLYRGGFELTVNYKTFLSHPNSTLDKVRCVRF